MSNLDNIPDKIYYNWQKILVLISRLLDVPVALIMKSIDHPYIKVLNAYQNSKNPFEIGEKINLYNTYCGQVIKNKKKMIVNNSSNNFKLNDNKFNMTSYLGFPIIKPDGDVFGTICVSDNKERDFTEEQEELILEFKKNIENQIELIFLKEKFMLNKEKLEIAVNSANLGLWNWNLSTGKIELNDNYIKMITYDSSKLKLFTFAKWKELLHPDDLPLVLKKLDCHLNGKVDIYRAEYRLKTENEKWRWLLGIGKVIERDNNGNPVKMAGIHFDVDRRKKAEIRLQKQKAYFQQLFEKSPQAIALVDNKNKIIKVNKSFEDIFYYKQKDIKGKVIQDLVVPEEKKDEGEFISRTVNNGENYKNDTIRRTKTGELINVSLHVYPIKLLGGQIGWYAVYNDITERKEEEEKIKYLSFHDQLTGLYNRRYFENELKRLEQSRRLPISIMVLDIDGLKTINDTYGHTKGDEYIKKAGEIIESVVRDEDVVARIGGDEFAVILPEAEDEIAGDVQQRIQDICFQFNNKGNIPINISAGFSTKRVNNELLEKIFVEADNRMYQTKNQKKRV